MSPISSDDEYFSDDDGEISDDMETQVDSTADESTHSPSNNDHSVLTFYKLVGDNADITVHQRYMRTDVRIDSSLHYFNSYAIADRINFSTLSDKAMIFHHDNHALAMMLLPSLEDEEALHKNFRILIARILYDNLPFFKATFDECVIWHIKHIYYDEMSKKSVVVSHNMSCICIHDGTSK